MKIKMDFVTNSSSTSFILIYKKDFAKEEFLHLMGVEKNSGFRFIFEELYEKLMNYKEPITEYFRNRKSPDRLTESFDDFIKREFSEEVLTKIREAERNGKKVFAGGFSSDVDKIELFFCTDSFLIENNSFYLNAINCIW